MSLIDTTVNAANDLIGDELGNYVLISQTPRYIGTVVPDVTVEEVHNDRLEITQHPIQTGAVVSDHSFAPPATCVIRCGFSDSTGGYPGYVLEVYQFFLDLQATRQPFDVSTGKRSYTNMLIRELGVTTDVSSEYALMCAVSLQQVTLTDTTGNGITQANQMFPQQTAPEINQGLVKLIPVTTPVNFYGIGRG